MYPETASLSVVLLTGKMEGTQRKKQRVSNGRNIHSNGYLGLH